MKPGINYRNRVRRNLARRAARGSALLIVVVLLLLASLFVLIGLNVGRFEQRTSGNDLRAKMAQEIAEAGLAAGVEYFNARRAVLANNANWTLCGATDDSFPCGAVPASRRGTMYRYHAAGTGGAAYADRLVPLDQPIASIGGFAARQDVGAVLCRISRTGPPTGPTVCATSAADASLTWVITVVSKGTLPNEGSSATVTQTVGAYNIFGFSPGIPPIVAAGPVDVGGGLQVVTAPNGAGPGIPVSVWTRLSMTKAGTPNTCYFEDFLRQGGSSPGPQWNQDIIVCHSCQCPGDSALSFPKSGGQACQGMDIVDIDNNEPNDCGVAPNLDIRREEFPKDLFAFVFGQQAWNDVNRDGIAPGSPCTFAALDCNFAEQRIISQCNYPDPVTGAPLTATLPQDTCYLLNIRNKIHIGDGINDAAECNALGGSTSGLVWVHAQPFAGLPGYDCSGKIRGQNPLGSPSGPVALIHDGALTQVNGLILYGLLFVREPNGSTTLDKNTGGSANFSITGNASIYGAAVVQGQILSGGGGTAAIVYNGDVLTTLINNPNNFSPTSLPGSWTDRLRY